VANSTNLPKISVLMPVYNAESYVAEAVESILKQTFTDFEFIIINDGSKDNSLEILQHFAQQDSRIKLISRENRGIVDTLNEGLGLVLSPLVARMDADDVAYPERFFIQKTFLDKHPEHILIGSRVLIIDEDGDAICEMGSHFSHDDIVKGFLSRQGQLIYHPSIMFRTKDVLALGGYRHNYPHIEDLDMFLRIARSGKIENLNRVLIKYREHFQKIGHLHSLEQENEIGLLLEEEHEARNLPYVKPKDKPITENISNYQRMTTWAWWALNANNPKSAQKYAFRCLKHAPFSIESWRLMACVFRGY
jgi:glycosyltransferase involved in cell wall biosynthesis